MSLAKVIFYGLCIGIPVMVIGYAIGSYYGLDLSGGLFCAAGAAFLFAISLMFLPESLQLRINKFLE